MYLVGFAEVSNDTLFDGGVELLKSRDWREAAEFSHLFVRWQSMVTSPMNDVRQTILIKIYKKIENDDY